MSSTPGLDAAKATLADKQTALATAKANLEITQAAVIAAEADAASAQTEVDTEAKAVRDALSAV